MLNYQRVPHVQTYHSIISTLPSRVFCCFWFASGQTSRSFAFRASSDNRQKTLRRPSLTFTQWTSGCPSLGGPVMDLEWKVTETYQMVAQLWDVPGILGWLDGWIIFYLAATPFEDMEYKSRCWYFPRSILSVLWMSIGVFH